MKVDNDNKDTKTINVKMIGVADGVDKTVVSDAKYTVKKADGTVIFAGKYGAETTSNTAITVKADGVLEVTPVKVTTTSGSALATKQLDAGTYTVIAEKEVTENTSTKTVTISTQFTLSDSQAKAEVEVKNEKVDANTVGSMLADAIIVTFDGKTYTSVSGITDKDGALEIGEVKVKKNSTGSTELTGADISVASGDYFNVTKLTVKVQVADGVYTFVSVSVPGAITAK